LLAYTRTKASGGATAWVVRVIAAIIIVGAARAPHEKARAVREAQRRSIEPPF